MLLDAQPTPDTGPVITLDGYERSYEDVEGAEAGSDVEMTDGSGEAWKAGAPDAVRASNSEGDEVIVLDNNNISEVSSQVDHSSEVDL